MIAADDVAIRWLQANPATHRALADGTLVALDDAHRERQRRTIRAALRGNRIARNTIARYLSARSRHDAACAAFLLASTVVR